MTLLERILAEGNSNPQATAVCVQGSCDANVQSLSYRDVLEAAAGLAKLLGKWQATTSQRLRIGLIADNSPCWMIADLALLLAGATEVPVPSAFSMEQAVNLLQGTDYYLVDVAGERALRRWGLVLDERKTVRLGIHKLTNDGASLHQLPAVPIDQDWICKIIHTSGTTGHPKGVKIRYQGLSVLVDSLLSCVDRRNYQRYLSLVPLSLLIEQVTALYMTASSGGQIIFLPESIQLIGSPGTSAKDYLAHIRSYKPSALTLTPALVDAIAARVGHLNLTGPRLIEELFDQPQVPFMACGGGPTDARILEELASHGIPIYEGYGLSENSSVVAWNRVNDARIGTVGRPLPHVHVRLREDGELLVKSESLFAGYSNEDPTSCALDPDGWLCTGDLAAIDDDGFIRIIGRKKNLVITANGRNINPEWMESRYRSLSFVEHAVILGDGLEQVHGLFIVTDQKAMLSAERLLRSFGENNFSQIERVDRYHIYTLRDNEFAKYFTITGRPQREKIWNHLEFKMKGDVLCQTI